MNFSMSIRCPCGTALVLEGGAVGLFPDTSCAACNAVIWFSEDGLVRTRTLVKAWKELQSEDFILGIVFSAVAVECELGRVFTKWKNIDSGLTTKCPGVSNRNEWIGALSTCGILQRLDRVSDFLTGQSFDAFLAGQSGLAQSMHERHPKSVAVKSLRAFFHQNLFRKRDQIIHCGRIELASGDAEEAFKSALTLFQIISEMDFTRRHRIEENLRNPDTADAIASGNI